MGALTSDVWVCAECRSINNPRAKHCYNCRTPRDLAAVDPASIEGTGHGKLRDIGLPAFQSPRPYAVLASVLILATAGVQLVYTLDAATLTAQVLDNTPATDEQTRFLMMLGWASFGIAVAALVAWSLWLSRVVSAMPALGLGYPAATGSMAFIENFLPGLNLLRIPAIVRDVTGRIAPGQNRGEALIFAAWIGLLLGFIIPRVGVFAVGLTADSPDSVQRSYTTITLIATGVVLVGAVFLVGLIWWIEERIARRREAQLAAIDAAAAGAGEGALDVSEEGVTVPASVSGITEEPPAAAAWRWGGTTDSPLAAGEPTAVTPVEAAMIAAATMSVASAAEEPPAAPTPSPVVAEAARIVAQPAESHSMQLNAAQQQDAPTVSEAITVPDQAAALLPVGHEDGSPHLTIRVVSHGMLQAEMAGESEPVILEDLEAYGTALANAGGTAEIVIDGDDGMAGLVARRAQRIMSEAGIEASIPD